MTSEVVGRWELGVRRELIGDGSAHVARSLSELEPVDRCLERYRLTDRIDGDKLLADIRASARILDPALLTVIDLGISPVRAEGDRPLYLVTEYWEQVLAATPMNEDDLLRVARAAASALTALHGAGLHYGSLHRGSLRWTGEAWKLAPAGVASILESETAAYRPPGLHVMEPAGPAADLWNLGIVLHELGNGRLLRPGETPRLPDAPFAQQMVVHLLQSSPAERPPAASILRSIDTRSIDPIRTTLVIGSPNDSDRERSADSPVESEAPHPTASRIQPTASHIQRKTLWVGLAGAAVLLLLVGGFIASRTFLGGADEEESEAIDSAAVVDESAADPEEDVADDPGDRPQGTINLSELQVGDCIDIELGQGTSTADRVSCDVEHVAEVTAVASPQDVDGEYPGRKELLAISRESCDEAFASYVGGRALQTVLAYQSLLPTFADWDSSERRSVICLARRYDGRPLTGSVANGQSTYQIRPGVVTSIGRLIPGTCFDTGDDLLQKLGKRQDVTIVSCRNAHVGEVYGFGGLPLEEEDEESFSIEFERFDEFVAYSSEQCSIQWSELVLSEGLIEPQTQELMPDFYDWQVGDRLYLCIALWSDPVLSSVVLNNSTAEAKAAEGAEDQEDNSDG